MTMRDFSVVVERDSEGYYVASVPAIPGCHTQAKSLDELMPRIREKLNLEAVGEPIEPLEFVGVQRVAAAGMRHPVSSCESLVVRDGGVMQLLVVEGAIVPGAPKDAYPGAGEDANGMGMIAALAASALVDVCCPGGCVSGVVGEAGDGSSQAMVACPAEDDTAALAGGVGDRADAGFAAR